MDDYSIFTGVKRSFHVVDYVVFSLIFAASAAIGFYHAYKDRHVTSAKQFSQCGRTMHPIPVCLSLAATFMSALTLLGNPAEIYTHGTMFYWILLAILISTIGSAHIFVPIFYRMETISCFGYIQQRFGSFARVIASAVFLLSTLQYMGFVLYAPSLAFEAVTGLSLWGTMIAVSAVCTLYTALGGMKTVIWTDSLQITIMFAGVILVLIFGSKATGGFARAWEIAAENGRIEFLDVSVDPRTRHSVWSVGVGGGLFWTYLYGVNQAQVQRACSLPTLRKAQLAIWMNFPVLVGIISLTCMTGIVLYAFYHECDPVKFGLVNKPDQMLPLFVLDILGTMPGLSGLFLACVFSGSLSSISSALNAMSAVIVEDFVKPSCCKAMSERTELIISKVLVVIIGFAQFFMAIGISQIGGLILQLSYTLFSILGGPILGLFIAGAIFPWTNRIGASVGFIVSLVFMCWLGLSAAIQRPSPLKQPLPISVSGCNWNATDFTPPQLTSNISSLQETIDEPIVYNLYRMSYQWYTGLGMVITVVFSLIISFMTGRTEPKSLDNRLLYPLFYNMMPCLPDKYRKVLKFGVTYNDSGVSNEYELK